MRCKALLYSRPSAAEGPGPPAEGPGPLAEGPGAARTVRATADRRRRGARGGGAARTVRATAAAVGPGVGGGRPQRVPDKLIKYEEKTEMRETTKNPDLTSNLQSFARFRRKPKMTFLVVGFRPNQY